MSLSLPAFARELLTRRGALVEHEGDENLEIVLTPELARGLERPEWLSVHAGSRPPETGTEREWLGFGADLFRRLEDLLDARVCEIAWPDETFRMEKMHASVRDRLGFNNAVYDDAPPELCRASWLLVWARYAAISDDRREGMVSFWIDEANLSCGALPEDREEELRERAVWPDGLGAASGTSSAGPAWIERRPPEEVLAAASRTAASLSRVALGDHLDQSRRRLERDVRRVCEYYGALKAEADRRAARLDRAGKLPPEAKKKLAGKTGAIATERKAKIADLRAHYVLRIEVEPAAVIRVTATAPVFPLRLKRRKKSRPFPLLYNPLIHRLEHPACEACGGDGSAGAGLWICDDRLHILCDRCFAPCATCGGRYCRACRTVCPKGCGK